MSTIHGKQALQRLLEGNQRFAASRALHPHQTPERRAELLSGQQPFAAIVGCSDSRIPPEVIFDLGLGDIFVIRTAGNVLDDVGLGSLEYAVEHLHVPLILVVGHENCGAVTAALQGGEVHGHLGSLLNAIQPAVSQAKTQAGNALENAIKANMTRIVEQIKTTEPILSRAVQDGSLEVVGAYYQLATGKVVI
ncbi:carbonic anhydrase [Candidatus Vecturithrix granuli]|uniref:Carbonic anhydrase n=1 Tax=Vecturithrix granuli TaxID=1499967 RepID=A0A081C3M2_VECG1|nr:carbonic anhydrase [Candidatus Vecturithrix granuli]